MKKAVIFDLDGTLLDTLEDLYLSVNHTLDKLGFCPRTREEVRSFVGNGVPMLIRRSLPEGADARTEDAALECFKAYYREHSADHTRPYDGIIEALSELKMRGICVGVVSNKVDFATRSLCEKYFSGLVDMAQGQADGFPVKPDPASTLYVMDRLGAERGIYVGDSEVDIQTAAAAGLPCVSVSWGFKSREFLIEHGAGLIADTPTKMLSYILKDFER